ncbi:MAG: gliding motility protein GldM [Bacteroidaceae bacterium]|nr:gliding motility protein GldM [Bacteroidaceae bacterium]
MPVKKRPVSPRQKMINLMYVVLMAMLALNVSSDVLNGFSLVEKSLQNTTSNASQTNQGIYADFEAQMEANPKKVKEWYDKAQVVRRMSDSLFNLAEELKVLIVRKSDGKDSDVNNIQNREDLEAATSVMLAPGTGRGKELYNGINNYRERIVQMVTDSAQRRIISSNLSTEIPTNIRTLGKNWQEYMFESMPTAAAVTLLTKLQSDVRYAEGEVLHGLASNIGVKDIRVNELNAYVIPSSQTVVQGGKFSAQILMAAVDTTNRPTIYIGGKEFKSDRGIYETVCSRTGDFNLVGYIEMMNAQGELVRREFQQKYTVVAPSATVSADLMNVLYAGYDNPMSVSVPGVATNQLQVSMSGGNLTPTGEGKYIAKPTQVGGEAVITVAAKTEGHVQEMGKFTFRVRKLPDPSAFIAYSDGQGGENRFKGGKLSKQILMNTDALGAAVDDGLLNIPFRVTGFETVFYDNMGNAIPEVSASASFTARQKTMFRSLSRGKRFFITHIKAVGPDGVERTLDGAMDVTVN